jgi:hypothetical protein
MRRSVRRGPVAALTALVMGLSACAAQLPSVAPPAARSRPEMERDEAECEDRARPKMAPWREKAGEALVPALMGLAAGAVTGAVAVGARRGRFEGSAGHRDGTDLLIVAAASAVGLAIGTVVGLARLAATSRAEAEAVEREFTECMTARGYR